MLFSYHVHLCLLSILPDVNIYALSDALCTLVECNFLANFVIFSLVRHTRGIIAGVWSGVKCHCLLHVPENLL